MVGRWLLSSHVRPLVIYMILRVSSVTSLSPLTRLSTLFSNDGKVIIGNLLERKSNGVHEVLVASSVDDILQGNALKVTIPYVETAGSVGSSVWPSSVAGSILLHCSRLKTLSANMNVLEVGSGLGLGGLVAAKGAAHCVLSDNDEELVKALQKHIATSQDILGDNVSVRQLDWRDEHSCFQKQEEKFDFCLGLDVAYYYYLVAPLVNTIRATLKEENSLLLLAGQANREQQWHIYHHIRDGGYNQITDEHELPWEGTTKMLLYKLQMGLWNDGEFEKGNEKNAIDGVLPIAALLHAKESLSVDTTLTLHDYLATQEDESSQMMTF